jgi:hypothetical protein
MYKSTTKPLAIMMSNRMDPDDECEPPSREYGAGGAAPPAAALFGDVLRTAALENKLHALVRRSISEYVVALAIAMHIIAISKS